MPCLNMRGIRFYVLMIYWGNRGKGAFKVGERLPFPLVQAAGDLYRKCTSVECNGSWTGLDRRGSLLWFLPADVNPINFPPTLERY